MQDLPPLAWIAHIARGVVLVEHGTKVETGAGWIVEGVWDGPFDQGRFHESEAFFGSGLRIEGPELHLVPSVALTDRILWAEHLDGITASNCLSAVLAATRLTLDPDHGYMAESYALKNGVVGYDDTFRTLGAGILRQLFHRSLVVRDDGLEKRFRGPVRTFRSFSQYRETLAGIAGRIVENARAADRRHPMGVVSTISSGYDAACVTALTAHLDLDACFTATESNTFWPSWISPDRARDDGSEAARALGLEPTLLDAAPSEREVFFRSANCIPPELAFDAVPDHLGFPVTAVFTGFHGDTVWGLQAFEARDEELPWPEPSGHGLSEGRLACSIVNVGLPFALARSRRSIRAISTSEEMAPWRVGGGYDRPIPRRILESAGVPREAFGRRKKAILVKSDLPLNRSVRRRYLEWLGGEMGRLPAWFAILSRLNRGVFLIRAAIDRARTVVTGGDHPTSLWPLWKDRDPRSLMFRWAAETLRTRWTTVVTPRDETRPELDASID